MIYYNIKIQIQKHEKNRWLKWMYEKHIKDVLKTKCFKTCIIYKEDEKHTYIIQYKCENREKLKKYFDNFYSELKKEHEILFKNKFTASRSITELIKKIQPLD